MCLVFLLVMGEHAAYDSALQACQSYFREFMRPKFTSTMEILCMLFQLTQTQSQQLYAFLSDSTVEPYVALPWLITWFAHHIDNFEHVARLYDVLLTSHPLLCLYLSAAVRMKQKITLSRDGLLLYYA